MNIDHAAYAWTLGRQLLTVSNRGRKGTEDAFTLYHLARCSRLLKANRDSRTASLSKHSTGTKNDAIAWIFLPL